MQRREIVLDPEMARDIDKFESVLAGYLDGSIEEDAFRVFRLTNGIYGQRQGGTAQMVRVRIPYGQLAPEQLEMMGHIAETYSRGWGHITTRQNIQFHFVELTRVPDMMRDLASVGMTSREACGDTNRNVQGCHLGGACPYEVLDITAWAQAANDHFLRNPLVQRLPRKFKINFSGCDTDCGQAMFNDAGVIAVHRQREDGSLEAGFRVFVAGGLGSNPHPALALEEFTPREELLATLEAIVRVQSNHGNRDNKLRARMKWLVDTMGWETEEPEEGSRKTPSPGLRDRILKERKFLLASSTWPGGVPDVVAEWGDDPAGTAAGVAPTPVGHGVPVTLRRTSDYDVWQDANVVRGNAKGTVSAYAWSRLGDITADQFRSLASIQRELGSDVRVTNRQNLVFRDLSEDQVPILFDRLSVIDMAMPGAELSRDVVACPGADTCNLAVTQSRGLADAIGSALDDAGLAEVPGIRTNISGCTNSCGQHHIADIGFFGAERRAHKQSAPGYQMLLGGYVGQERIHFGEKALRLPAKNAPKAAVQVVSRFAEEREPGEDFRAWLDRSGGAKQIGEDLADLDHFPTPEEDPDFYVDYGETGPYVKEIGESECAT